MHHSLNEMAKFLLAVIILMCILSFVDLELQSKMLELYEALRHLYDSIAW